MENAMENDATAESLSQKDEVPYFSLFIPFINGRVLIIALCCIKVRIFIAKWREIITSWESRRIPIFPNYIILNNYFMGGSLCVLHFLTRDLCVLTLTRILSNM